MAVTEALGAELPRIAPSQSRLPEWGRLIARKWKLPFHAADDSHGLAKRSSRLLARRRMRQRNKHLPPTLSDSADGVRPPGDLARTAVLMAQPLEYPGFDDVASSDDP